MKILLAGPGTGKTTKIRSLVNENGGGQNVLILSFTNATINDLQSKLAEVGITGQNCMTLHKFAVKYNHDKTRHVLLQKEIDELNQISKITKISFNELCDFLSCTTFDQMIARFVGFSRTNEEYLKAKLSESKMLIVDEYQDFNPHEQALIDMLIKIIPNSFILGDDDQCIYDFKDASNEKIISFYNDANNEKLGHEHKCFRCPDKVVHHASQLIKNNKNRVDKKWEKSGKPGEVFHRQLGTYDEVASYVVDEVEKILSLKNDESVLILSPVQFATPEIIEKLQSKGVPFTNHFVDRIPENLIIESWKLKVLFSRHKYTNLIFLGYYLLKNRKKFYEMLSCHFREGQNFGKMYDLLEQRIPEEVKKTYMSISEALKEPEFEPLVDLYNHADGDSAEEKLENIFRKIETEPEKQVNVMTIHKSKGLDAHHVFMIGLTEGIIPNRKQGADQLEGYRRQFYVGMTRSKKQLFLISNYILEGKHVNRVNKNDFRYSVKDRQWYGKSSSFIQELGI